MKFDTIEDDIIRATNLGDSGYMIIRPDENKPQKLKNIFKTKE